MSTFRLLLREVKGWEAEDAVLANFQVKMAKVGK